MISAAEEEEEDGKEEEELHTMATELKIPPRLSLSPPPSLPSLPFLSNLQSVLLHPSLFSQQKCKYGDKDENWILPAAAALRSSPPGVEVDRIREMRLIRGALSDLTSIRPNGQKMIHYSTGSAQLYSRRWLSHFYNDVTRFVKGASPAVN